MDHESLRTASTYLNNLLLARGLLRNSDPIDFVKPSKESRAQIINLVHDLILREDRSRDQQDHIAVTLRQLRADETRHHAEMQRAREKTEESVRAAVQARAAERAAQTEAKKVERAMKSLHDQAARLKASVAQIKTQCANDVKKRDLELARLKTHLQGQQRGNKVGLTAPSMTITGGKRARPAGDVVVHGLDDPEYTLKQETTEFLTQLSQSLSDENDSLIGLVRGALATLKELLGLSTSRKHPDSAIGSMGSNDDKHDTTMLQALPTAYDTLATGMELAMEQLKAILCNPNFVSIEEVEVRDEEIRRLRAGWEHMERRWKDVFVMFEDWRRRMDGGETINVEDLRRGMGLVSPNRPHNRLVNEDAESSFADSELSEIRLPSSEASGSSILEPSQLSSPRLGRSSAKRKRGLLEPPELFDLRPGLSTPASPRPGADSDAEVEGDDSGGQARLTVAEKLTAAQAEAENAVAARATTRDTSKGGVTERSQRRSKVAGLDGAADAEQDDTLGKMPSPVVKRTKIKGRPRRRKSTLSREELEALITSTAED